MPRRKENDPSSKKNGNSTNYVLTGIGVVLAVISCLAAVVVVPEIRSMLGLESQTAYQQIYLVDYSNLYEIERFNLGLNDGNQELLGIPFDIGWKISTQGAEKPGWPTQITIATDISNPEELFLLIQAGWGYTWFSDKAIGNIALVFENESRMDVPLVLGDNIRDWTADDPNAVTTSTSSSLRTAYKGIDPPSGKAGHIDLLTITVQDKFTKRTLKSIIIEDITAESTGSLDPALHLLGITVKYKIK